MSSLSLKQLAIRGTLWTVASYGTSQMLRFGSNLLLTHLLFPQLFGLMALANVFVMGLHLFSDIGVGPSIIQNKRGDDPAFLNTAWTLQIIRGVGLWAATGLIAYPLATFYGEPQLAWLIPALGFTAVISGFNSTALYTLNRQMAIAQLSLFQLGGQVISIGVMLGWAWISPSIWALVAGNVISAILQLIWSHWLNPGSPNRLAWNAEARQALLGFGQWIFISTAMTFLAEQADRLILGKLFSLEMLGVYGIGLTLADLPRQVILAVSDKVIFPTFTRFAEVPRFEFRAKILQHREKVLLVWAVGLAGLVLTGDWIIQVLYDQRYNQAAWMLPLLALGIWPKLLTQTVDPALFAIGQPRYVAFGNCFKLLFNLLGIPLGFALLGVPGAVLVVACNDLPFYGAVTWGLWREQLNVLPQDLKTTGIFVLLLLVGLAARAGLGYGSPLPFL